MMKKINELCNNVVEKIKNYKYTKREKILLIIITISLFFLLSLGVISFIRNLGNNKNKSEVLSDDTTTLSTELISTTTTRSKTYYEIDENGHIDTDYDNIDLISNGIYDDVKRIASTVHIDQLDFGSYTDGKYLIVEISDDDGNSSTLKFNGNQELILINSFGKGSDMNDVIRNYYIAIASASKFGFNNSQISKIKQALNDSNNFNQDFGNYNVSFSPIIASFTITDKTLKNVYVPITTTTNAKDGKIESINKTIECSDVKINITRIQRITHNNYSSLNDGEELIGVYVNFKNTSDSDVYRNEANFNLVNHNGEVLKPQFVIKSGVFNHERLNNGTLVKGGSAEGYVIFLNDIENDKKLTLRYTCEDNIFNDDVVKNVSLN